jgi:hypothetical protein
MVAGIVQRLQQAPVGHGNWVVKWSRTSRRQS